MCVPTSVPSTDHTTVTFGDWEKASQATTFATESKRRQTSTGNGSSLSPEEPARLLVNPVFSASAKAFAYRHWRVERKEKRFSAQEKTLPPKQKGGCGGPVWQVVFICNHGLFIRLPNRLLDANRSSAPSCSPSSRGLAISVVFCSPFPKSNSPRASGGWKPHKGTTSHVKGQAIYPRGWIPSSPT